MGVQAHQFLDRKDNSSGLSRDGMRSGGYSLCSWIAPGVQILHPEALLPFTSNRRQRVLERKSWHWAALAVGTLTLLLFNTDGEPQLASTVIDTIMAGLPGPRGAPGPVGPPGNALS